MKKINIKNTKTTEEYIKIMQNISKTNTMYSYIKISNTDNKSKHTFNKTAFIEYLKSINLPKKYIKEVEESEEI